MRKTKKSQDAVDDPNLKSMHPVRPRWACLNLPYQGTEGQRCDGFQEVHRAMRALIVIGFLMITLSIAFHVCRGKKIQMSQEPKEKKCW